MISPQSRTAWLWVLLLLLAGGTEAQSQTFSANPVMVKGSSAAPVTIVEFSDYQ